MENMTGVENGFVKSMRVVLQECLESQWYHLGKKFIAHASVTENMVTPTDEPVFDLVFANKPEKQCVVKTDILALAYLDKTLNDRIDKMEQTPNLSDDDVGALAYYKKLKEKVKYARSASLLE